MKKLFLIPFAAVMAFSCADARERTADELVASKRKADITYGQLMEVMGTAMSSINDGILRRNPLAVENGVRMIVGHPAPNHKPWSIVAEGEQAAFKETLLAYDPILDSQAEAIAGAARNRDWMAAADASSALLRSCVACHAAWQPKVR